ncbi:Protease synthase and sporulation protein PAI 2 [compost metagenome]|uniref:Negative transcriptional regulator, PaiB family n=1 Tax=Pseudomonas jinjuensis TaxID=198616 RepID=A0A1H0KZ18_9PSED|nr:FMN-binding negative transcriptional regulator [Pseudomonas jinjuensis]SDO60970.1 negative transcriptional regulator, PaiB family [Pseudomonas jinjuensis]
MYLPTAFRQKDTTEMLRLIAETRLATLVTAGAQGLQATHLPLILEAGEGEHGTLYGHLARGNPQWRELAAGTPALVIFQGPDAYVSPAFYPAKAEHGKVVPTWNYIAVHAHGTAETIEDAPRLLDIVTRLTRLHEQDRAQPWAVSDAPEDYIAGMLRAIVGLRLPIERLEGKWKLSQNRSPEDIEGVRQGLAESPYPGERQLAERIPKG